MNTRVYLLGPANTGKTSLFNRLTDSQNRVANYFGATTTLAKKPLFDKEDTLIYDLPGTYNINGFSKDEALTVETLRSSSVKDIFLFVLDGVNIKNNLKNLSSFVKELNLEKRQVILAINMMDEVKLNNIDIQIDKIKPLLQCPVFLISTKKNTGVDELANFLKENQSITPVDLKSLSLNLTESIKFISQGSNLSLKRMYSIDRYLVSSFWGLIAFVIIMLFLFQSVFTWAAPFMDLIEFLVTRISGFISPFISNDLAKSFVQDALFGGIGAFIVFVPQIFILSFLIKVLEDTGYLARASIVCHKIFTPFGLTGESFIPLLTSHACAIPGIYATRHIKSKKIRFVTLLTLPLTVCSARLPVYALLISFLVPSNAILAGLFGLKGLVLFALYLFGILMSLIVGKVISLQLPQNTPYFFIELPRYQFPDIKNSLKKAAKTSYGFVANAGPIIFAVNVVVWFLASFPQGNIKSSYLHTLGSYIVPLFKPLGFGLNETIGILTSFLARETFVSTLATLYGSESDEALSLANLIKNSAGSYTLAQALSLIVFFAVALQCVSTLAVIKQETGSRKITVGLFVAYTLLAYALSFITFQLF